MNNAAKYTYRVHWSPEDQEYVATVAEFPSLSWLTDAPNSALEGLIALVKDVIEAMADSGEQIPQPLSEKTYSGKFMVRIPPEAHRQLAMDAAEQNVSLNKLASRRLVAA